MKILQINKFFYRRRGAETYMFDVIDLLEKHNNEIGVFSMQHPDNASSPYSKYFLSNIEYSNLQKISWRDKLRSMHRVLWSREAQKQLELLLQEFAPDIAHIHNIYHQISPSILATLKKHRIPIVHTLHDYKLLTANYSMLVRGQVYTATKGGKYYNELRHKTMKDSYAASALAMVEMYTHKFMKVYEKNVDCFISPSHFLKDLVLDWNIPVKRIEVLRNFVDTTNIQPTHTNKGYILYAGGLYPEKGVDTLLDSLANFKYDFALQIAGTGPELSALQQQAVALNISQHVTWLGHLPPDQLAQTIANAAVVVVPSRWYENCPYSVLEAFAHGKPVIATDIGGLPELVQPNTTGWLFELNNTEALRSALHEVYEKPERVIQYGKAARTWVETNASPDIHYKKLHAIYQDYI